MTSITHVVFCAVFISLGSFCNTGSDSIVPVSLELSFFIGSKMFRTFSRERWEGDPPQRSMEYLERQLEGQSGTCWVCYSLESCQIRPGSKGIEVRISCKLFFISAQSYLIWSNLDFHSKKIYYFSTLKPDFSEFNLSSLHCGYIHRVYTAKFGDSGYTIFLKDAEFTGMEVKCLWKEENGWNKKEKIENMFFAELWSHLHTPL